MTSYLDIRRTTNLFGPLRPDVRVRLQAVVENPTEDTWENAHSIILNARTSTTLWQAVCAVDPLFPASKLDRWSRVPTRETLLAALHQAVLPPLVTCRMDPGRPDGPGSYHHGPHEQASVCDHPERVEQ